MNSSSCARFRPRPASTAPSRRPQRPRPHAITNSRRPFTGSCPASRRPGSARAFLFPDAAKRKSTRGRKRAKGEGKRDRRRRSRAAGCARHKDREQHGLRGRGAETPTWGPDPETLGPGWGCFPSGTAWPSSPVHAGNCSSPSLRDPVHRPRPPPPALLQRRPPQPRWRHLPELTSEDTSPVMT